MPNEASMQGDFRAMALKLNPDALERVGLGGES